MPKADPVCRLFEVRSFENITGNKYSSVPKNMPDRIHITLNPTTAPAGKKNAHKKLNMAPPMDHISSFRESMVFANDEVIITPKTVAKKNKNKNVPEYVGINNLSLTKNKNKVDVMAVGRLLKNIKTNTLCAPIFLKLAQVICIVSGT